MRAHEFLLEYDREITLRAFGKKMADAVNNDLSIPIESITDNVPEKLLSTVMDAIEASDPDLKSKKYVPWIVSLYAKGIIEYDDLADIKLNLEHFEKLKPRFRDLKISSDINHYDYASLKQLMTKLDNTKIDLDSDGLGIDVGIPGLYVYYKGPLGMLCVPTTKEASIEIGRGTQWCTAYNKSTNRFDQYLGGPLFVWIGVSGKKFQFWSTVNGDLPMTGHIYEFMGQDNKEIPHAILYECRHSHPVLKQVFAYMEKWIIKNRHKSKSQSIITYAQKVIDGRWPEAEKVIIDELDCAMIDRYFNKIVLSRWPEAEAAMVECFPNFKLLSYALDFVKEEWPLAEPRILAMDDFYGQMAYLQDCRKREWPELEAQLTQRQKAEYLKFKDDGFKDTTYPDL